MKKVIFIISLCVLCFPFLNGVFAGSCPDSGWSETGKVEGVDVSQNDRLRIKFDWSDNAVAICKVGGSTDGAIPASSEICKAWLSQALTALASGKNLIINHTQTACIRAWDGLTDDVESVYLR